MVVRVNIVTVTTAKGPAKQEAVGMYLVEMIQNGVPSTKQGFLHRESITSKELTLQLFANALYIAGKENSEYDSVECYLDDDSIVSAFDRGWIDNWQSNNWKNARGIDVANADTWKSVCKQIEKCAKRLIVKGDKSSYSAWMDTQCKQYIKKLREQRSIDEKIEKFKERMDNV